MYEWDVIKRFAETERFGEPWEVIGDGELLAREQLRCLWTAYCILYGIEPGTKYYDVGINEIWSAVISNRKLVDSNDVFDNFECFDLWMGEMLS